MAQGAHAVLAGELGAHRGELAVGQAVALGPAQQVGVEDGCGPSSARISPSSAIWSTNQGSMPEALATSSTDCPLRRARSTS